MNLSDSGSSASTALGPLSQLDQQGFHWSDVTSQPDMRASPLISATEWTKQRCRIRQLYLVDGLTRSETRLIMKYRYGFNASDIQYKHKIKKWSFQKSLTHNDKKWLAEARYVFHRSRKTPAFILSGQPLRRAKISRQIRGVSPSVRYMTPAMSGNLNWYDLNSTSFSVAVRELRSVSTIKGTNLESLRFCCITCPECELDFYSPADNRLWVDPFEDHFVQKHANLSHRFGLTWCMSDPAMPSAPNHRLVHDWNYAPEWVLDGDGDEEYDYDHYPDIKQMLKLLDSMTSTSVVQEEPQTESLWLVDLSDDNKMKPLALITRCADKTPRNLIQSLLTEISSQTGNQASLSSANPAELETAFVDPGAHIVRPATSTPFETYGTNTFHTFQHYT